MLTPEDAIKRLRSRIPKPIFEAAGIKLFLEVLYDETLVTFSSYYWSLVEGIVVYKDMMITQENDYQNGLTGIGKYIIPMEDENYPFVGIATLDFPLNNINCGTFINPGILDASFAKVSASMNPATIRYTPEFEAPNIIKISPPPKIHLDFTVSMKRVRKIEEVKLGHREMFLKLFVLDCKIRLYNEFFMLADGGTFAGIEISSSLTSDWSSASDDRDTLIEETFATSFYKEPEVFREFAAFGNAGFY